MSTFNTVQPPWVPLLTKNDESTTFPNVNSTNKQQTGQKSNPHLHSFGFQGAWVLISVEKRQGQKGNLNAA
ncbi:MAG: hypothetical protein HQL98_03575 [Magnetococcales bacterium]|nr:hypothetical protein [Magnetococcales bacterium]